MLTAYKFATTATKDKPDNEVTRLLEADPATLTRDEKDRAAAILYGTFGPQGPSYKLAGWEWPMYNHWPRFLVKISGYGWLERYAPDKTSLRRAMKGRSLIEIVAAPI